MVVVAAMVVVVVVSGGGAALGSPSTPLREPTLTPPLTLSPSAGVPLVVTVVVMRLEAPGSGESLAAVGAAAAGAAAGVVVVVAAAVVVEAPPTISRSF